MKKTIMNSLIVLILFISGCEQTDHHKPYIEKHNIDKEFGNVNIIDKFEMNNKMQYIMTKEWGSVLFPGEYYVTYTAKFNLERYAMFYPRFKTTVDNHDIYIREFDTGNLYSTIDVKAIMDEYYPEYQIVSIDLRPHNTTIYEGRKCVVFVVEKIPDNLEINKGMKPFNLYISIEDDYHNINFNTPVYDVTTYMYKEEMKSLMCTNLLSNLGSDVTFSHSIGINPYWKGTKWENVLSFDIKNPIKYYTNLVTAFPKVKPYLKEKNLEFTIYTENLSEEELISLFSNDEIISNKDRKELTLSSSCSIDGEPHVINSIEEMDTYFKVPEDHIEGDYR